MSTLRTKIVAIFVVGVVFVLCQCEDKEKEYSDIGIVTDNAQATLYFHVIFREAENVWAFVHGKDYESFDHEVRNTDQNVYKEINYDEDTKLATVEYHAWVTTDNLLLTGKMTVEIADSSYRTFQKVATVRLSDFSIMGQDITGTTTKIQLTCQNVEENPNDIYSFALGATIYEKGYRTPVLITASIANGQYQRIEGNETDTTDDDVWTYSGTMNGTLHEDQKLKCTNTIDQAIHFTTDCKLAKQGIGKIAISGRPNIKYEYDCSSIFIETEQLVVH